MTLYQIACSILLTVTVAAVPDAKQAFEKYVKERGFMKEMGSF